MGLYHETNNMANREVKKTMKKHRLSITIGILVLLACLSSVQAADQTSSISQIASNVANIADGGVVNQQISQLALAQYSDFYSMPSGSAPKEHIEAPKKHEIKSATPTTIFFGYQMQAVPYTQYQTYATYTGGNSLWIQGSTSWSQYAIVPQGAILSILATTSTGGNGYLYEINPNGQLYKNSFYFYPGYNQINFYADTVGQHILLFVIGSQVSNAIVIDVVPYYPPTYYQQPYQQINYPSYYTQGNPVTVYYSVEQPPKGSKTPSTAASSTPATQPPATQQTSTTSNQPPRITSFTVDATSPMQAGPRIRWTTETIDPDGDTLYFRYLVKGPQTNGLWKDYSAWIPDKYWSWVTSMFKSGQYQIQVQVRDKYHAGENSYDDARIADFTLT